MGMEYGFSGLNKTLNSKNDNLFNSFKINNINTPVRVLDIVLDENHPLYNNLGIGGITYEYVLSPGNKGYAIYNNSAFKQYPLINEIVIINSQPKNNLEESNTNSTQYYSNPIALWSHPHHNGYPTDGNITPIEQNKTISQTQIGSVKDISNKPVEIKLGNTFKEKGNIHPLLPFEGDIIYEGRWGHSIRFGSTVNNKNNWSSTGENGDPILIIRNGQGNQNEEGWKNIIEDINNDDSSIYLTSNQKIPINVSSKSYISYRKNQPTNPNEFVGKQVIINSGRLVFNSSLDHILFSSAKSINFNSIESINIDTPKTVIQSDKIYLGNEEQATEPLLLGKSTVDLLSSLIEALSSLSTVLQSAQTSPAVPYSPSSLPSINTAGIKFNTTLELLKKQLNTITSKRNYTV